MKPEDYFILTSISLSALLSAATTGLTLSVLNWAKGRRLWLSSAVIWASWWIFFLLLMLGLYFLETRTLLVPYNGKPFWLLTVLRMSAAVFVTTGVNAGVLKLLKSRSPSETFPPVWRASSITSLVICLTVFGFNFLSDFLLGSYFFEPEEYHCGA